jgi:hypothetical protein
VILVRFYPALQFELAAAGSEERALLESISHHVAALRVKAADKTVTLPYD